MVNRKKAPVGMYTASEAWTTIGIPQSSFYNLIKNGTIRGVTLPGRKEAYYPKSEIDRYARAIHSYIEQFNDQKYHFGLALIEDIPDIRELVANATGGYSHTVPAEIMEAWLRRNPEALHILRKGTQIVGYISMFPLPLDTIIARLSGKLLNRAIPIDDIQPFVPNQTIRLYIAEAVVKQTEVTRTESVHLGRRLIEAAEEFLVGLGEQSIAIKEIYAVATSQFGIRACRSLKMQPMDLPEGTREERIPYWLDVQSSDSRLVTEYKKAVESAT